ncbi:MAG: glycoside hydrolase family 127 protein [Sedimentisphaerales bacterium]|nr:glycoside hydrolase family 127 protein [Sedimentisphaerales bacterium]
MSNGLGLITILISLLAAPALPAERALTATHTSPYARFGCTDIEDVHWTKGFWADRFELCHKVMIPNMWQILADPNISHAYENLRIAAGLAQGRYRGPRWHDGDFYKWLEAAAYVYGQTKDRDLDQLMDQIIEVIAKAQRSDGYIHSPVVIAQRSGRSDAQEFKDRLDFETYNMGHLITCACIHYRATGKDNLLNVAIKAADYLYRVYKDSPEVLANNAICPSHYMGIVELYRTIQDPRYLELARGLIEIRSMVKDGTDDNQDRIPFYQQRRAVGHAVRANYLYAGAADVFVQTGDQRIMDALQAIWQDVTYSKIYVTGATGALYDGASPDGSSNHKAIQLVHQAYGRPYQLPNITAYNESCATIGFLMWAWRMWLITAEPQYMDWLEISLYNGVLSTISLDGKRFFYRNTLRQVDDLPFELRWSDKREPYISCFCCPPNIVRTIAEVSAYAYNVTPEGLWINLYGSNHLSTKLAEGSIIELDQHTDYPWDGRIRFTINKAPAHPVSIHLRIPGWAKGARVAINGRSSDRPVPGTYLMLKRSWSSGDRIELDLPIEPVLLQAHPFVEEARNQVAVRRGPVVYCLESVDLPKGITIHQVCLPADIRLKATFMPEMLDGVAVLDGRALALPAPQADGQLYRRMPTSKPRPVEIRLIPYYAWGNRGHSEMTVWIPVR